MPGTDSMAARRRVGPLALACSLAAAPALVAQHGWVAETQHFRVMAPEAPGLGGTQVAAAIADLETIRRDFERAGLGLSARADGRTEILIVPHALDLRSLLGDPASARTRGVTVRGLDRDYTVAPWHELPGPRITLAHEYAHHLDDPGWPPWFREGRAVYLGRRTEPRTDAAPLAGLAGPLGRPDWIDWAELLSAEPRSPATRSDLFQPQSWLLVHWLASRLRDIARLSPRMGDRALAEMGPDSLDDALRRHLAEVPERPSPWLVPLSGAEVPPELRPALAWEVPLFKAEAQTALRMLAAAEPALERLAGRFPRVAAIHAAGAALQLVRGRHDLAERRFGLALALGDSRARSAYRYANLLMRPGAVPRARSERALLFALSARERMPHEPTHHLAVAHARMLLEDWAGAYAALQQLLRLPGWAGRAGREALEVRRRRTQALRAVASPEVEAPVPAFDLPGPDQPRPADWKAPAAPPESASGRWPPYGTWVAHGRVAWVRCSGNQKTVIVHSPYRRLVLRESPERPPRLINRPFRDKSLPCDSRGWVVAVAYRKSRGPGEIHGELVGMRF